MTRRVVVVANPRAGGGRARTVLPAAIGALRDAGAEVAVVESTSLRHAVEVAGEAARFGATIAALGGDGLVGALAAPVADAAGVLGVIPGGRGNDFARGLGLPRDPAAAARVIVEGHERRIDLGLANGAGFVGIASIGFDSETSRVANETRWLRGRLVYSWATLRVLAGWRSARFTVRVDGAAHDFSGYFVSVANAQFYGGGMRVAPHALLDDGLLDVVSVHDGPRLRFLAQGMRIFSGTHVDLPTVTEARGAEVVVDADRPFTVYADGDPLTTLPATITVRRGALRVAVPA